MHYGNVLLIIFMPMRLVNCEQLYPKSEGAMSRLAQKKITSTHLHIEWHRKWLYMYRVTQKYMQHVYNKMLTQNSIFHFIVFGGLDTLLYW